MKNRALLLPSRENQTWKYRTVTGSWLEESHTAGGMNDDYGIIQGIRIRISSRTDWLHVTPFSTLRSYKHSTVCPCHVWLVYTKETIYDVKHWLRLEKVVKNHQITSKCSPDVSPVWDLNTSMYPTDLPQWIGTSCEEFWLCGDFP